MADIDKIEKRLTKLENRFDWFVDDTNSLNSVVHGQFSKLRKIVSVEVKNLKKTNQIARNHVDALEKQFKRLEKNAKKMKRVSEPRQMEQNTMRLVDQALRIYDQKKAKR